jgi:hypothetical protein
MSTNYLNKYSNKILEKQFKNEQKSVKLELDLIESLKTLA